MSHDSTYAEILLAGAFAAFTVDLLVYPLDTIKTRLQSQDYIKTYASPSSPATPSVSSATDAALRRAIRSPYALRGLYQGVGSVVVATLPASGIFFSTYESAKLVVGNVLPNAVNGGKAPPAAVVHSLSSGIAELASCLVLTPAEVIKQNAQMIQRAATASAATTTTIPKTSAIKPSMSSSLQALQMLRNAEGGASRRLLSGYSALVARNVPFTALQFPMFEAMRVRLLARWSNDYEHGGGSSPDRVGQLLLVGAANGLSAGASGAVAAVVTTPSDVIKTRMMLSAGAHSDKQMHPQHKNALQLTRLVYHEHGMRGMFRGGALRAAWTFVGSGLYLGTYEMAKAWLRNGRESDDAGL
ncbi:mitochondrial carrier protein [Grosmannia clavigera kw1407]|uniref:Mitochondrial carrier protein n=1 Tax=Grosmannia clavigera (strain kw1407 / UAMH 11150) TaxID=655863 RepID=F0XJF5_GROCL|nr:mitochondrial carrier protein [Grosmannia clavigera kw1407]EFX02170.1 mitochondrial carrier protein [Grosmannia clavigera kw1407]